MPLVVAAVLALGGGVGLALALREAPPVPQAVQHQPRTLEEARAFQLRLRDSGEIPEDRRGGEEFLASRWGHLGDVGLTMPGTEVDGQRYFIEPKVVQAWTPTGRNYATIIASPFMMDESQRYRGKRNTEFHTRVENFKPRGTWERLSTGYKPITKPEDLPPDAPASLHGVFGQGKK